MDWWSARVPEADELVLGPLLRRRAKTQPDGVHVVFDEGDQWTWQETWRQANGVAIRLQELGVRAGDRVVSWFPNGPDALRVWYGANLLGAVYVPLNTAYRGRMLEHAVTLSQPRVVLVHPSLAERLQEVDTTGIEHIVVLDRQDWPPSDEETTPDRPIEPWDPYAIILTSGTTGPSKGVVCSYTQVATAAAAGFDEHYGESDRYMVNLPLFHAGGTVGTYASILLGGSIAVVNRFDTGQFWSTVRRTGTTHVTLLGVMATFLNKQPAGAGDRDHPLKHVFMIPLVDGSQAFANRFGVRVVTMFNMTETSIPIVSEVDPVTPATCGRVRAGVQARLVDEHDREVVDGEIGELVLRTDRPWAMNSGYWNMPEATAEAWRNGWFHTGDAFRRRSGEYFFVDRRKDAIRRRGENISSFEVETELCAHPAVLECAAVAVPSPFGEDDILAVLAPVEGRTIDPVELIGFARERMPHFMVPRYVRVVDELPKTPTSKIEKHRLRAEGLTADTWDREASGISVKSEISGSRR